MAAVEERNGSYRVVFRFRGKQQKFLLGSVAQDEAESTASKVDYLLMRLKQGLIQLPDDGDIIEFVRNDGNLSPAVPEVIVSSSPQLTLAQLRDQYVSVHDGSLESTTLKGMEVHFGQFVHLLGEGCPVQELTHKNLQDYVKRRAKDDGIRGRKLSAATIRKEIVTLKTAWNWAVRSNLLEGKLPVEGLRYPKFTEKPVFQTMAEIEKQIALGGLSEGEQRELWDALFLTLTEIDQLLKHVRATAGHPWIYPMFCTAAHTGARRSELLRAKLVDVDFTNDLFVVHERKRVRGKLTSRRVPLSPFLRKVLESWIKEHPGGPALFAKPSLVRGRTHHDGVKSLTPSESRDHFARTLADSKWSVLRGWHVFRHSFCSNLAMQGIDQRLIDEFVGHQTEEQRRRYRHLAPSVKHDAIRKVFGAATLPSGTAKTRRG